MTTRRLGLATLCSVAVLALAVIFSLNANANAASGNPLLVPGIEESYEVAIEPLGPPQLINLELPKPEPTAIAKATPVAPPAWIEIPSDLITAPLPSSADGVPLPVLTNISAAARSDAAVFFFFD